MKRPPLLVFACAALAIAGCASRFESFPFVLSDGTAIAIRESPGVGKEAEGLLSPGASGGSSPVYRLTRPAAVSGPSEALALLYSSSLDNCLLTVYASDKEVLKTVSIPSTGAYSYRILVPLPPGGSLWGFALSTTAPGGSLKLLGAGTAPRAMGFSIKGNEVTLDGSILIRSADPESLRMRLSDGAQSSMAGGSWTLNARFPASAAAETIQAVFSAPGSAVRTRSFTLSADAGARSFVFPAGSIGFVPQEVSFRVLESAAAAQAQAQPVESVIIGSIPEGRPIPADPGLVLRYNSGAWRNTDFEFFSWTRFPGVLVFDTRSYAVQDDLFKRLAFFVEKPGYAGTIPNPAELSGKHGWNAHDYKAEDLARFFDVAEKNGIPLTPGETDLLRIILAEGMLQKTASGYAGEDGAVLSVSRESGDDLRRLLLAHECSHGVFFSLSEFRDECAKAWSALSDVERRTWLLFLESNTYDVSNDYLVINEFQSYLFQQPREKVADYQALILGRLKAKFPGQSALLDRFLSEHPDSFLDSFNRLDAALRAAGGPPGGQPFSVE